MKSLWSTKKAKSLSDINLLVYASRLLGQSTQLVLWGGGNSSLKGRAKDLRGRYVETIWVKGSGSDMKSCEAKHFTPLRMDDLLAALARENMSDAEMVEYFDFAKTIASAPRPSIETLLHAFLPFKYVLHTHADAILSLTNNQKGKQATVECYGKEAIWIPYIKPGFALAKKAMQAFAKQPRARAIVLENHGLITFANQAAQAYAATIEFVTRAENYVQRKNKTFAKAAPQLLSQTQRENLFVYLAPALRGTLSSEQRVVLHWLADTTVLKFLDNKKAALATQQGPATPDHMLRTKRLPLLVSKPQLFSPSKLQVQIRAALDQYKTSYQKYWQRNHRPTDPMLGAWPKIILIPGLGMITAGKNKEDAIITAEIYSHTMNIITQANRIAAYRSLSEALAYEMEYWDLELYKLSLAPAENEFSRKVALITGAACGIGRAIAQRFARESMHLVLCDINQKDLRETTAQLAACYGADKILPVFMDVGSAEDVWQAFQKTIMTFGGLDIVVSNAGSAHAAAIDRMELTDWENSFRVNATGHFLVAQQALSLLKQQGLGGSIIFNASKNVLAPGKDFAAYSAAKSAETQLAKIVAIEGGEFGIRANILHPDAVFENSKLWSSQVKKQRARAQGIAANKIEKFYRQRNLLKRAVTGNDVAEAALFFASDRSAKTTGCCLTVDGGLREAFPR